LSQPRPAPSGLDQDKDAEEAKAQGKRRLLARARRIVVSSTFRLAMLYVLLLGGSVAILLGFIYWSTAGYMARQTDATIGAEAQGLAEQYRRRGLSGLTALVAERSTRSPGGAAIYLLTDDDRRPLVGNLDRWPDIEPGPDSWLDFRLRARGDAEHAARAKVFLLRGGLWLLVGRDVRELTATRALILDALTWGLAITAALALLGGWLMSAGVVRRLETINQVAREIMQGDLARRVPSDGSGDDFDQLAGNLNRMLDRIEGLMAGIRQVSDNIAHDLRTPLSRLRTRLELIRGEPPADTDPAEIDAAIADAEELLGTFNALLRIARIESGGRRAGFAPTDLGPLLADLVELYEPLAADKGQALVLTPAAPLEPGEPTAESDPLRVNGDRDLLFQAIANLVDNAIKYSPEQGRIEIDARRDGDRISIQVADTGSGIPPEQRAKVFQRFYRLEDSRTTPGNGLGLSLVQAVAQLHGAEISLDDNRPGLRVTLILKALTD